MHIGDDQKRTLVDFWVLLAIIGFLLTFFQPQYIFSKTITTGGDTASHYYTAKYLMEYLLPHGKVTGWDHGNYAGAPILLFYFPLPFVIMALLGYVIPLQIAFKIGTILGIFLLPICTYFSLRLMRFRFPIPILGALFTLPFLFMEANSMWGGNILSTLAGEFSYSLSFALSILFLGSLYDGIKSGRHVLRNGLLVGLIGFGHGYTLLFAGVASLFFLITTEGFWKRFWYLFRVHTLGFCLMGFWIVPLIMNLPNTTGYNFVWVINSISEILPPILVPLIAVAVAGRVIGLVVVSWRNRDLFSFSKEPLKRVWQAQDDRVFYLWFGVIVAVIYYKIAFKIHVVDIRFLPFLQFILTMIAAVELGRLILAVESVRHLRVLRLSLAIPLLMVIVTFSWVKHYEAQVHNWIPWNYNGFEKKPNWNELTKLSDYLRGGRSAPRVIYENTELYNNEMGTIRTFESLPLFSGRSTLEGLYLQASISAPFVFYIQSETSKEQSCPFPDYSCTFFNFNDGIRHLKMFNVRDFIVRSDQVKAEVKANAEFQFRESFGPYDVYELTGNENRYVTPLQYEPVLYETKQWKVLSYRWFRNMDLLDVPLVFTAKADDKDLRRFKTIMRGDDLSTLPRIPVDASCNVSEKIKDEEIDITTDCINKPLLIKISYHPKWKVEGADRVYLVSPSFMLVYPQQQHVRLRYSAVGSDYVGTFLTFAALLVFAVSIPPLRRSAFGRTVDAWEGLGRAACSVFERVPVFCTLRRFTAKNRYRILAVSLMLVGAVLANLIFFYKVDAPSTLNARGTELFGKEKYAEAQKVFEELVRKYPLTAAGDMGAYYYAICYWKVQNNEKTIEAFEKLIRNNPTSTWVPEAYYHIGLANSNLSNTEKAVSAFKHIIEKYPVTVWAGYSKERINEFTPGAYVISATATTAAPPVSDKPASLDTLYRQAMTLYQAGSFDAAKDLFLKIGQQFPRTPEAENCVYLVATIFYNGKQYAESIGQFQNFISNYPASSYVPAAYYHMGISHQMLGNIGEAKKAFNTVVTRFHDSGFSDLSKKMLSEMGNAS